MSTLSLWVGSNGNRRVATSVFNVLARSFLDEGGNNLGVALDGSCQQRRIAKFVLKI